MRPSVMAQTRAATRWGSRSCTAASGSPLNAPLATRPSASRTMSRGGVITRPAYQILGKKKTPGITLGGLDLRLFPGSQDLPADAGQRLVVEIDEVPGHRDARPLPVHHQRGAVEPTSAETP